MATGRAWRAAAPAVTSAGLAVLVWAAVAGPARIIGPPHAGFPPRGAPPPTVRPSPQQPGPTVAQLKAAFRGPHHLAWVGHLLAWTALLLLALALLATLVWLWRNRWRRPAPPLSADFEVLPTVGVARELERTAEERAAALERGSARNAIVACWLLVEESIARAGLPRMPWETSTEFTVRVLHTLDIDPRPIGSLSRLYREARFSRHPMGEDARTAARAALQHLESDLHALGVAPRGPGGGA